jgi:hypothetical protein
MKLRLQKNMAILSLKLFGQLMAAAGGPQLMRSKCGRRLLMTSKDCKKSIGNTQVSSS